MSTEWYYAVDGTSVGPVSEANFAELVRNGTIRSETLVWQQGMEDWIPFGSAEEIMDGPPMPPQSAGATTYDAADFESAREDPARADANTFVGALKDGFTRYVDFGTRSTRPQFWWWALWSVIFSLGAAIVDTGLGAGENGPVGLLVSLVTFLPSIAVAVRRLHDIGRTGWWFLLVFVPVIGWIVLIVFYCMATQNAANQWGVPPRR